MSSLRLILYWDLNFLPIYNDTVVDVVLKLCITFLLFVWVALLVLLAKYPEDKFIKKLGAIALFIGNLMVVSIMLAGWTSITWVTYTVLCDSALIFNGYLITPVVSAFYECEKSIKNKILIFLSTYTILSLSIKIFIISATKIFFLYSIPLSSITIYMIVSLGLTAVYYIILWYVTTAIETVSEWHHPLTSEFCKYLKKLILKAGEASEKEYFFIDLGTFGSYKINCYFVFKIILTVVSLFVLDLGHAARYF